MSSRAAILKLLEDAGHGAHRATIEALIRPGIRVTGHAVTGRPRQDPAAIAAMDAAMATLPLGASRFGGLPDLPPGAAWPERDGVPMEFVAQFRLADLPPSELPRTGSLLFFYNSQWQTTDWAEGAPVCAVLHHEGADDALIRTPAPSVEYQSEYVDQPYPAPWVHGLATLSFETYAAIPGGKSPFVDPATHDWYHDWRCLDGLCPPSPFNSLLGYVDGQDYVDAHQNGTDDRLLLKVDSDDCAEFQWGDCDALYYLIPKQALAARDWSQVRLYSILG